ncbi:hypothetical protein M8494_09165 [Serratia ureilytica]
MARALHSHGLGQGANSARSWRVRPGWIRGIALQRWQASLHETQNDREVVELATPNWCSRCSTTVRGAKSAAPPPNRR